MTNTKIDIVGLSVYDLKTCRLFLSTGFFWSHPAQGKGQMVNTTQTGKPLLGGLPKMASGDEVAFQLPRRQVN